jgi:hypothetical protein
MPTTTLPNGIVVNTYPAPPASLDFGKATDEERARYGIPRFPAGSSDLQKRWETTVRQMRFVEPVFKVRERMRKSLPGFKPSHNPETSTNWSGGIVFPPKGDTMFSIFATWKMPTASLPAGHKSGVWYSASTWVGIDGDDGSGDVLQAGCDDDVEISGGVTQHQCSPWWEWYPAGSFWITTIPVSPGDQLLCWIIGVPLSVNSAWINLGNQTTGVGSIFYATAPKKISLKGNCAEWIVENLGELAKYTTVDFTKCEATTVGGKTRLPSSGNTINMVNSSSKVISKGKIVGKKEVQVSYV